MVASEDFLEHLRDLLSGAGPVSARRMFGGAGLYASGVMFALVADDVLYLKADERTSERFRQEGLAPFTYNGRGRLVQLSYWRAPERLYDDPEEMASWAQEAIAVAQRAAACSSRSKSRSKVGGTRKPRSREA